MNAKIIDIYTTRDHKDKPIASIHLKLKLDSQEQTDALKRLYDLLNVGVIVDIQEEQTAGEA